MEEKGLKEFIYFITHNKGLSRAQIARRDALLLRDLIRCKAEIISSEEYKNVITPSSIKFIDDIKQHDTQNPLSSSQNRKKNSSIGDYIPPKNLQKFLKEYNQNPILKYTCHLIDTQETIDDICKKCDTDEYNFEKHLTLIQKEFEDLSNKHRIMGNNMHALIKAYINGGKPWSSNNITIHWSHSQISNWGINNPGKVPNPGNNIAKKQKNHGCRFDSPCSINYPRKTITDLNNLSMFFKNCFHIRKDNSLKDIIPPKIHDIEIKFSENKFQENIELFTDVDKLKQSIEKIVEICKNEDTNKNPKIEIAYYERNENIYISIHHINSVYNRSLSSTIDRLGESHTSLIKNQLNGLANLYIKADFSNNEYAIVNLWNGKNCKSKPTEKTTGVIYILEF